MLATSQQFTDSLLITEEGVRRQLERLKKKYMLGQVMHTRPSSSRSSTLSLALCESYLRPAKAKAKYQTIGVPLRLQLCASEAGAVSQKTSDHPKSLDLCSR